MWMTEFFFGQLVNDVWFNNIFFFSGKIEKECEVMIMWNKEIFGNIFKKKKKNFWLD